MIKFGTVYQDSALAHFKIIKILRELQKNDTTSTNYNSSIWLLFKEMKEDLLEHNLYMEYLNQEIVNIEELDYHHLKLVFPKYGSLSKNAMEEYCDIIKKEKGEFVEWVKTRKGK